MGRPRGIGQELKPMSRLALPVVAAELGWMAMGMVDTLMVGRLGAVAIGAVSIGTALYLAVAIFGMGVLLGLDTAVAQAFGAGRVKDCHRSLFHGLYLSLALTPLLSVVVWSLLAWLPGWGIEPEVLLHAVPYLEALVWSTLPLLLYASFRRYLQAMGLVRPVMVVLLTANLVNVAANWVLIFGRLGAPSLGVAGAGWATLVSRTYLALSLAGVAFYHDRSRRTGLWETSLRPELARFRRLFALGVPAALQISLEVGVLATATALAGRLDAASLAAHQIALTVASFTYMVPLGVSSAGAIRVGHALGRRDGRAAERAGWAAILLGAGFMGGAALFLQLFPHWIVRSFTPDDSVVSIGIALLFVAAYFQLFDGIQVTAIGALRGSGDTRAPMVTSLVCYWLIGLPVGYTLCFEMDWGIVGLWVGLCLGLITVAVILLAVWARRVRTFDREESSTTS